MHIKKCNFVIYNHIQKSHVQLKQIRIIIYLKKLLEPSDTRIHDTWNPKEIFLTHLL